MGREAPNAWRGTGAITDSWTNPSYKNPSYKEKAAQFYLVAWHEEWEARFLTLLCTIHDHEYNAKVEAKQGNWNEAVKWMQKAIVLAEEKARQPTGLHAIVERDLTMRYPAGISCEFYQIPFCQTTLAGPQGYLHYQLRLAETEDSAFLELKGDLTRFLAGLTEEIGATTVVPGEGSEKESPSFETPARAWCPPFNRQTSITLFREKTL